MMRHRILALGAMFVFAASVRADLEIHEVAPGLYRGRVPKTEADFAELRSLGIRTVLDTRVRFNTPAGVWRERRRVEAHGITYRHERFGFFPLLDGSGERVVAAMRNECAYPMYVHCQLDRDRTSAAVAAYRVQVQGWSIPAAEAEARQFGIRQYFIGLIRYVRAGGMR
jgi:hypothetical protein